MKKNRAVRSLLAVTAFVLIMPVTAFAAQPPVGAEITDIYSSWAEFDIFMASAVYDFGNEGTYSNFRGKLMTEKFAPVYESLANALGSSVGLDLPLGELVTRGQIVNTLYGLLSDEAATVDEAAEYFASEGLIHGRVPGDYQLDEVCTVQEMIVLSVRVYEHAIRSAGEDSKGFFWEIEGVNNTVRLLGSVHLGDNAIYPFSEKIMSAFDQSANLVVEVNIADISEDDTAYITALQMTDFENGETIADYISEETFELYKTLIEALELPEELYCLKPWAAVIGLTTILMSPGEAEESIAIGVDMLLLKKASGTGKSIIELESTKSQIEMLASFSRELQEQQLSALLFSVLAEPGDSAQSDDVDATELQAAMATFIAAVKAGDDEGFGEIMAESRAIDSDDPIAVEYDNAMWAHRNIVMAEGISGLLESETDDGGYFVVVGAGHMFGGDSIVSLLTDMGYNVVRVK